MQSCLPDMLTQSKVLAKDHFKQEMTMSDTYRANYGTVFLTGLAICAILAFIVYLIG